MKKRNIYIVPFAHLDLFWAGTREECLSRGTKIISQALDLLEKHPDYRFMVESTSFAEAFLDAYPEKQEQFRRAIAERRLEIIPMRGILYSHLPSGETTVRNLLYGLDFCRNVLHCEPELMSLSDIPGAAAQLPQIARSAGLNKIILSRGFKPHTDRVRWIAPDGTEIQAYAPVHYADLCVAMSDENYEKMCEGFAWCRKYHDAVDYDQIMHWGMDLYVLTEKIFQNIERFNDEHDHRFVFSTFQEYFDRAQGVPEKILRGELPSTWPHIESSWPDIWPLDIPAENALHRAEFLSALYLMQDGRQGYPAEEMRQCWLELIDSMDHNQNGIGGEIADRDKLELKLHAKRTADQIVMRMCRRIAVHTRIPHPDAHPIIVFNPCGWKRSGVVRARAACYGTTFASSFARSTPDTFTSEQFYARTAEKHNFRLIDRHGNEIPYKKEIHLSMVSDSMEISFYAEDVPAFGCAVYYLEPHATASDFVSPFTIYDDAEKDRSHSGRYAGSDVLENRFFRLEIRRVTGELTLTDKRSGEKLLDRACIEGFEEKRGEYIYRMDLTGRVFPAVIDSVRFVEDNAVSCTAEIRGKVYDEAFTQKVTLYAEDPVVDIRNEIDWKGPRFVRVEQVFGMASDEKGLIQYGTPFGKNTYPCTMYQPDGVFDDELNKENPAWQMRLVQDWVSFSDRRKRVTVAADHRLWTFRENQLSNCMIRGIGWTSGGVCLNDDFTETPIRRPPDGKYVFRFRISSGPADAFPDWRMGTAFNRPFITTICENGEVSDAPGLELPPMPSAEDGSVSISWVKPAENGNGIVFRCFECMGEAGSLSLPEGEWYETDLRENIRSGIHGKIDFRPFEIKTILLAKAPVPKVN